jgi:hypothetical protein
MEPTELIPEPEMTRRQITLADGRYLIFYTFISAEEHEKENGGEDGRIEK